MAKQNPKTPAPATSIEMLGARLQKIINAPAAQKAQAAIIYKAPDEAQEDWDQIIEAITETDGVYITFQDDGATRVFWDVPDND
jgi:5'-deoxynucleotidase YfbR-like HD superfamily hydrolase